MTILTLQYLRGLAAVMVVIFHLETQVRRFGYEGSWPTWTFVGVDLFFVLSGFLMWAVTARRSSTPKDFFLKRLARIVPLYWAVTTVVVLLMFIAPSVFVSMKFDLVRTIGSYIFVALPNPSGWSYPVLLVGWTLNIEIMFYVVFALCLLKPERVRGFWVAGVLGLIMLAGWLVFGENLGARKYVDTILLDFIYGMYIAHLYKQGTLSRMPSALSVVLILVGTVGLVYAVPDAELRGFKVGIPAAMVFAGVLSLEGLALRKPVAWLRGLGDSSYSLYLTHQITLSASFQLWRKLGFASLPGGLWVFGLAAIVACCLVATLVFRFVESPLTRYAQSLLRSSPRA